MLRALAWFAAACCLARAQAIRPETLLADLHTESQHQPAHDRLIVLWDLAIAATGVDPATSARWSLEMYELAAQAPHESRLEQMNQAAARKNALTILSLTDPERAAEHCLELEPSPGHLPNEDPRIDFARHLFPRLWARQGKASLPAILRFAGFTSRTGQYPYVGIGHILPGLAKVDLTAAHSLVLEAAHRLDEERGIWRTLDDYMKFLRESWPAISPKDRRVAVDAAWAVIHRETEDRASAAPGTRRFAEYYLPQGTVRLDSEEAARVYELLPFVDQIDAGWGRRLRHENPDLANVPIPRVNYEPWRSKVIAAPGPNLAERVDGDFERHHLVFLARWANQDPRRASALAQATKDPARRRAALALILPAYAKVDPAMADTWRRELMSATPSAPTAGDLEFLAAVARVHFALGHIEDGDQVVKTAMNIGGQVAKKRDSARPAYLAEGAGDLRELADTYGEFRPGNLAWFMSQTENLDPGVRLFVLAGAVRGALRHRLGYQEPN